MVVAAVFSACEVPGTSTDQSSPAAANKGSANPARSASSAPAAPQVLLDVSGDTQKTTQKFTAGGDWDLEWHFDCAGEASNLSITSYKGDGSYDDLLLNVVKAKSDDVTHQHQAGTFYLVVDSSCPWHVIVRG
jgi:hypothetical protein